MTAILQLTPARSNSRQIWSIATLALGLAVGTALGAAPVRAQSAPPADTESPPIPQMKPPEVSDPMLAPPPAAPRKLRSWKEAIELLRQQAPDYLSSDAGLARAQAQIG